MTTRTVMTVLKASIAGFQGPMQKAAQTAIAAGKSISDAASNSSAEWDRVGGGMLKGGAVLAAGLGLATKAAMDWESQFAGSRRQSTAPRSRSTSSRGHCAAWPAPWQPRTRRLPLLLRLPVSSASQRRRSPGSPRR